MKNLGPKSREWLAEVGIHSLRDVERIGVVESYMRVKSYFPEKVSLNLLYGLQAALMDMDWRSLPQEMKENLKRQVGVE